MPFSVGDPGRAANVVASPDPTDWDRPDTVLDGVRLKDSSGRPVLDLRAASVRGRSHRYGAKARQDSYAFRCDGRYAVAVVTDGVSQGQLSQHAAEWAARVGSHLVLQELQERRPSSLDWGRVLEIIAARIERNGRRLLTRAGVPGAEALPREAIAGYMATTALFGVVDLCPVDDGGHLVQTFAYGDTSAWILRPGKGWIPQHQVKNSATTIASSETSALPLVRGPVTAPAPVRLRPDDVLVLVTDGLGDPLRDGTGSVGDFLAHSWASPPDTALEFAAHVDFARKSHDDDRTALAMWPLIRP